MKISKWYSLKETQNQIRINYKLSSRISAIISFILILAFLIYFISIPQNNSFTLAYVFIPILLLFLLFMSLLEDAYIFYASNPVFIRKKGLYPFIKKQKVDYSSIEEIELSKVKKKSFMDYFVKREKSKLYFTITIHYKERKSEPLGLFVGKESFEAAQMLKDITVNKTN